jgi:hypothetical protein
MKKMMVVISCMMLTFVFGGLANAGMFDSIKSVVPGGGSGGVTQTDIDAYFKLSNKADDLHQGSIDNLGTMLLNKDAKAEIDRKKNALTSIQDPKEKEAAMNQIKEDQQAEIEKQLNSKDSESKLAKLDDHQKKLAGAAISNLFLSALVNKSAVDVATGIVQKAQANPVSAAGYATQLPKIKDAVVSLPGKIEKTYTLGNHLVKLAKTSNIDITIPKTASDLPQEVPID